MVLDAESVIDRRRLKRRLTAWRIAAVALGLLLLGALLLNDPNMVFSATPKGIGPQVDFMHRSGFIKVKPDSWRDLFFPTVHHLPGS